jgi:hypothetical protein
VKIEGVKKCLTARSQVSREGGDVGVAVVVVATPKIPKFVFEFVVGAQKRKEARRNTMRKRGTIDRKRG